MAAKELLTLDEATPQIIAPQAGDTVVCPITLNAATGNEIAYDLQYTTNKATSGNDTGLLVNQTDTASPGTSLLADFQVGGVSKLSIDNTGTLVSAGGLLSPATFRSVAGTTDTLLDSDNGKVVIYTNGAAIAVTLPDTFDVNFHCTIIQAGAGVPTVTRSGTDTINGAATGVAPSAQWKGMYLAQYGAGTYLALV